MDDIWKGSNVALENGKKGSTSCSTAMNVSFLWRSKPDDTPIANGNSTKREGFNVVGVPPGIIYLQFEANILSTPSRISCSEHISGIERINDVIVLG